MNNSRSINVFLVEDNLLYRRALKEHLEGNINNINILTFNNGEEMMKNINQNPDVVVLDYMLRTSESNAGNGMSILKKVVGKKPYIPVIMLSEQKNKSVITQLVDEGAYDYVAKFENSFEKITDHIRQIESQLYEQRKEEKSLWNAMLWTITAAAFISILLYEISIHK